MKTSRLVRASFLALTLVAGGSPVLHAAQVAPVAQAHRKTFRTAIYVVVNATRDLADEASFERQYARAMSQVHFDKVYIEVYRNHLFATDEQIERVKRFFTAKGVIVSGGVTLAAGDQHGQFGTFDYELPADRAECEKAVRLAAKHFDEVVLDDFFFYTSKSEADIKAKGTRSWTQYRLDTMRKVANDLVLDPAHQTNPRVKMVIKYPNWYEHFQGLGFDLDKEAQDFDAIYTGTETRDPEITDQLLQPYESYEVYRYYSSIRPGRDGGGWVDTYSTLSVDRYAEQLWDTLFAKAPEITLFNWRPMADEQAIDGGKRPWAAQGPGLDWTRIVSGYKRSGPSDPGPGWGTAAGAALDKVDGVLDALGKPIGIASYRPPQSSSAEDFLHNYLGDVGVPIELHASFPADAPVVLLTQAAATDPMIVEKIKGQLSAGKTVVITSGLLGALQERGIRDVVEAAPTGRVAGLNQFYDGFGAGNGDRLDDPAHPGQPVVFPELHYFTNDAWPVIRGVSNRKGFPILLMDHYAAGTLFILNVPDNMGDLYALPQPLLTRIKGYIQGDFAFRLDAPPHVSLFAYDNDAMVVESFRDEAVPVGISVSGRATRLRDLASGQIYAPERATKPAASDSAPRTSFHLNLPPHSFAALKVER